MAGQHVENVTDRVRMAWFRRGLPALLIGHGLRGQGPARLILSWRWRHVRTARVIWPVRPSKRWLADERKSREGGVS